MMLLGPALILRWNAKAEESLTVSPTEVRHYPRYCPDRNGEVVHRVNDYTFLFWRPYQSNEVTLDYEVWGLGPWSLGALFERKKRVTLLRRLTGRDVSIIEEALRRSGYDVQGGNGVTCGSSIDENENRTRG
jgi:hypothetical protein